MGFYIPEIEIIEKIIDCDIIDFLKPLLEKKK